MASETALPDLRAALAAAREGAPRHLEPTHLGLFTAPEAVLFLAPRVTAALLDWQAGLAAHLPPDSLHAHFAPGTWVPHVTLTAGSQVERGLGAGLRWPARLKLSGFEVVRFPPAEVIATLSPA